MLRVEKRRRAVSSRVGRAEEMANFTSEEMLCVDERRAWEVDERAGGPVDGGTGSSGWLSSSSRRGDDGTLRAVGAGVCASP